MTLIEGRMVHYYLPGGGIRRAAVVANVKDKTKGVCDLHVFTVEEDYTDYRLAAVLSGSKYIVENVSYSEKREPGTWAWMERA